MRVRAVLQGEDSMRKSSRESKLSTRESLKRALREARVRVGEEQQAKRVGQRKNMQRR